jgi:hypothetical protein
MTERLTDIDSEFYELVGRAASDWAMLELLVNDCIWALAGVSYGFGLEPRSPLKYTSSTADSKR